MRTLGRLSAAPAIAKARNAEQADGALAVLLARGDAETAITYPNRDTAECDDLTSIFGW
jgi:hypothetical protein